MWRAMGVYNLLVLAVSVCSIVIGQFESDFEMSSCSDTEFSDIFYYWMVSNGIVGAAGSVGFLVLQTFDVPPLPDGACLMYFVIALCQISALMIINGILIDYNLCVSLVDELTGAIILGLVTSNYISITVTSFGAFLVLFLCQGLNDKNLTV